MAAQDESYKGDILIYVDGYSVEDWRCLEHNNPDGVCSSPMASGWAVGDNPRDRYCSRLSADKVRRFKDFDDAVRYVFEKGRKRKNERFQLIYQLGNVLHDVSTLDDILAVDQAHANEQMAIEALRAERRKESEKDYPGLDALLEITTRQTAHSASELLRMIRADGYEQAKKAQSTSSFYRLVKLLRQAGLVPVAGKRE